MAVKYTDDQLIAIKGLMEICGNFADQILHILQNHNLDTEMKITVNPDYSQITRMIEFGEEYGRKGCGYIKLVKGLEDNEYTTVGRNSHEYECLFAGAENLERVSRILQKEKGFVPDDLPFCDDSNPVPVDCGVQMNGDSMAES